jgi:hypothetical protein
MKPKNLTESEWEEIYYALDRKAIEIERGRLDDEPSEIDRPGSETARWAAHLRQIMIKIAARAESDHS